MDVNKLLRSKTENMIGPKKVDVNPENIKKKCHPLHTDYIRYSIFRISLKKHTFEHYPFCWIEKCASSTASEIVEDDGGV